jgi:hypothetical protein
MYKLQGLLTSPPIEDLDFEDLGSWSMGPDVGSEDLDQDRPQGSFTLSCFEDLDIFRPGILDPWSR